MLINLVGNAIKFTSQGEVGVDVQIASQDESGIVLHFLVQDTGVGIPPEKHDSIFAAFEQADMSTTREFGGTGLGLAITRKIVETMGGAIWVESQINRGSTFHFTLPLEYGKDGSQSLEQLPDLGGRHVMLVDDNATNRHILREILQGWDLVCLDEADPEVAYDRLLAIAERGDPLPLLISDVHMPKLDGFGLVERIREHPVLQHLAVILLTSGSRHGDLSRSKDLGVVSYLIKPAKQSELLRAIIRSEEEEQQAVLSSSNTHTDSCMKHEELPKMKILLAEDGLANQKVALGLLATWDHEVKLAVNGAEAVKMWKDEPFDAILMDIQMPLLNGLEATRQIREQEVGTGNHIPIIAMTAHAMKGDRARCLEAGMDDYLAKPVRRRELFLALYQAAEDSGQPAEDQAGGSAVKGKTSGADRLPNEAEAGDRMSENQPSKQDQGNKSSPDEVPVIDWKMAMSNVADDKELFLAVKDSALEEIPGLLPDLTAAIDAGNQLDAQRLAHTIKGAARVIAATKTMLVAERIEHAANKGHLDQAKDSMDELRQVIDELVEVLNQTQC
jgi:CheY-like chemotaxis protein